MKTLFTLFCTISLLFAAQLKAQVNHWAFKFGGLSTDETMDICKDPSGNIISTGYFTNTMPVSAGLSLTSASAGVPDIFISKTDNSGNVVWLKRAGGSGSDRPYSICSDLAGNTYITGSYYGSAAFGSIILTSVAGSQDVFIAKIDANGNFVWARSAGGSDNETGNAIAVDNAGNVFITGEFEGTASFGSQSLTSMANPNTGQASFDVFISKYDSNGNILWAKKGSADLDDRGLGIGCDNNGNVYVCGQFSDNITFQNTYSNTAQNAVFLVKYNGAGQEQWFRKASATYSIANDLVIDNAGNIYFTGDCQGNMCFYGTPNHFMNHPLLYRAYIAKYASSGAFAWAKCDGSINEVSSKCIALDPNQDPYMYGEFKCRFTDYSSAFGDATFSSVGFKDLFVCKYSASGARQWFRHAGGRRNDKAHGLALLETDEPVMAGSYEDNLNFPVSGNVTYHVADALMTGCNGPYCSDNDYGNFLSFNFLGYVDGFLCKVLNPQRAPYDYFRRSGPGCNKDTLRMCVGAACPDTIPLCLKGYIDPDTRQCWGLGPSYLYSWNGGAYDTVSHPLISTPGYLSMKVKSIDGCSGDQDTVYVKINPLPAVPLMSDDQPVNTAALNTQSVVLCSPDSLKLWTANAGNNTVSWRMPNSNVFVPQDTMYSKVYSGYDTVKFTSPEGCIRKNQMYVKFDFHPLALQPYSTMLDSVSACQTVPFIYQVLDSLNGNTCLKLTDIQWSSTPALSIIPDQLSYNQLYASYCNLNASILADSSGLYSISAKYIYNNSCGADTFYFNKNIYITVNPKPVVAISYTGSTLLCLGDSTALTFNLSVSNCPNCQVQVPPAVQWYNTYGLYYYFATAKDSITGCATSELDSIRISPKPDPKLGKFPVNGIICPNDSVRLTCHSNGLTLVHFQWYGPNGSLSNPDSVIYASVPGPYYCIVQDADSCVFTTNTIEVKQYNTPYLMGLPGTVICNGQPVTLKVVCNDSTIIQWLAPFSGGGNTQQASTQGTYSCTASMCGVTTTCVISVTASNPSVSITAMGTGTICPGDSLLLHGSSGPFSYQWLPDNDSTQDLVVDTSGSFVLQVTDTAGCTVSSSPFNVYVNGSVVAPSAVNDTVCLRQNAILGAASPLVVQWYSQASGGVQLLTGPAFTINTLMHDTTFYVSSYDPVVGCHSVRVPVNAIVNPYSFPPLLSGDSVVCSGNMALIDITGYPAGASIHWSGANAYTSSNDTVLFYPALQAQSGTYSVYISGDGCSSDTLSHYLQVNNVSTNLGHDTTLCSGNVLVLQAGHHPVIYWQDSTMTDSYTVANDQGGAYSVYVADSAGCWARDTITVSFITCDDTIPNIFTPNGDGINDVFSLKLYSGSTFSMLIYDRWGSLVAKLDNEHTTWDGRSNETKQVMHDDTYFYVLQVISKRTGKPEDKKGFIVLQR